MLCPFARSLCIQLMTHLNLQGSWIGVSLEEAVEDWVIHFGRSMITVLVRVWWGIWIHRNKAIFENSWVNVQVALYKSEAALKEQSQIIVTQKSRKLRGSKFNFYGPWAFFDGAMDHSRNLCEVGITIILSKSHYFHLRLGLRKGTNMFAELLSLWGLILFA